MITARLAMISASPYGYTVTSIFLRAKITKSGIRAKGRYLPKYLTRSGISFFEKNKNGVDLIRKVVTVDVSIKINVLVMDSLDSFSKSI